MIVIGVFDNEQAQEIIHIEKILTVANRSRHLGEISRYEVK